VKFLNLLKSMKCVFKRWIIVYFRFDSFLLALSEHKQSKFEKSNGYVWWGYTLNDVILQYWYSMFWYIDWKWLCICLQSNIFKVYLSSIDSLEKGSQDQGQVFLALYFGGKFSFWHLSNLESSNRPTDS